MAKESPYKGIYLIPRENNFFCELAKGVLSQLEPDAPEKLAQTTIFLPNQRAVRTLRAAFLRQTERKALLLPRIIAVGEISFEELSSLGLTDVDNVLPVINGLERQWQLSEFLCKRDAYLARSQALLQACDLAGLLDEFQSFKITTNDLEGIVANRELAVHWQETLNFMSVISHIWPRYLEETFQLDPQLYRNALLNAQVAAWGQQKKKYPVIVAGNISAQIGKVDPTTLGFMKAVLALPQGSLVMQGLDEGLSPEEWLEIDSTHPDYQARLLLEDLSITRADIHLWPACQRKWKPRQLWLREAMRPSNNTASWQNLNKQPLPPDVLQDIELVTCETEQEEAQAIALIIRQILDEDETTVSLVTPDRNLVRLVSGHLKRWNIKVGDSAGVPLLRTPLGIYLMLLVTVSKPEASVFDGLALGKHYYTQMGHAIGEAHSLFDNLERLVLRQTFVGPAIAAWKRALNDPSVYISDGDRNRLEVFFNRWLTMLKPLRDLLTDPDREVALSNILDAHISAAEAIAATDNVKGAERLWAGAEGQCIASFFYKAKQQLGNRIIKAGDYTELLKVWLAPENVRSPYAPHPRVNILGLIESRLQQADVVILGGLNEGTWPEVPGANPFLSRHMMRDLGLPDSEARIGQAAHDFMNSASAPKVYLTRAQRNNSVPTVPARWLLRMDAVLTDPVVKLKWQEGGEYWRSIVNLLDKPDRQVQPIASPAPMPPLTARPRELSVTQIEQWLRDPYGLYAKKVLGLRHLAALQTLPNDAQRGQLVHSMLEAFTKATLQKAHLTNADYTLLLQAGMAELQRYADQTDIYALWRAYLTIAGEWLYAKEKTWRKKAVPVAAEIKGQIALSSLTNAFTLTARIDRLDVAQNGNIYISDYKTGTAPTITQMKRGGAAQLALEALLVVEGAFANIGTEVEGVVYWQVPSRLSAGAITEVSGDELSQIVKDAKSALIALIEAFDNPDAPYLPTPLPDRMPRYNDYAHLERTLEWAFAEGDDELGEAGYG